MNPRGVLRGRSSAGVLAFLLALLAGCSNQPAEVLGPAPDIETRHIAAAVQEPPLPPISGWEAPRIRLWTDGGFRRTQDEGGIFVDRVWDVEVQPGEPVTFQWTARPMNGRGKIQGYRWALDIADGNILDETPRIGPGDLAHWSEWSLTEQSATVGPFEDPTEVHYFYLEARDRLGFFSLVTVRIQVAETGTVEGPPLARRR